MGAGLPTEGTNAEHPRARDLARNDVPTCGLTEKLGDVKARIGVAAEAVVVVNDERVVLGLLRSKELATDPAQPAEKAMRPGPALSGRSCRSMRCLHFMVDHKVESAPITTSGGGLVGLLLRKDVVAEMEKEKKS